MGCITSTNAPSERARFCRPAARQSPRPNLHQASEAGERILSCYRLRRKLRMCCCAEVVRLLKFVMTAFASEPGLEWVLIACSRSLVRPSCRKKMRCPTPHNTAERNSSPPAVPCETLSARPVPMWCTSKSENRFAVWLLSPELEDAPVCSDGVWHSPQPIALTVSAHAAQMG